MKLSQLAEMALVINQAKFTLNSNVLPKGMYRPLRQATEDLEREFAGGLLALYGSDAPVAVPTTVPRQKATGAVVVGENQVATIVAKESSEVPSVEATPSELTAGPEEVATKSQTRPKIQTGSRKPKAKSSDAKSTRKAS